MYRTRLSRVLRSLFRRPELERELDDELQYHLDRVAEEHIRTGMTPSAARRAAKLELGGSTQVKEACRQVLAGSLFETIVRDVGYGWRSLRKNPGFTGIAVLTLALGIGANTAIFSVINGVLIEPLPYSNPEQLSMIWTGFEGTEFTRAPASGPQWNFLRQQSELLEDVGGIWASHGTLNKDDGAEQIKIGFVTANFFSVLGVSPSLGRTFLPEEEGSNVARTILLSDELWRNRFGAVDSIVGRTIQMNGLDHLVIGVMPPHFKLMLAADASIPADLEAWVTFPTDLSAGPPDLFYLRLVARRQGGASLQQVQSEMEGLASRLGEMYSELAEPVLQLTVIPLHGDAVSNVRPALLMLWGAVGLVLLLTCANVANLLLARASRRAREMALRTALGASRSRLIRQLLCESLLLAGLGAVFGLFLAWWGLDWLLDLHAGELANIDSLGIDLRVLGFTALVAMLCGIGFGVTPIMTLSHINPGHALKDGTRSVFQSMRLRSQGFLVVSEIALGFILLIGAGLMLRTYQSMQNVQPGFIHERMMTFQVHLPGPVFPGDDERAQFARLFEQRLQTISGVEAVGAIHRLPLDEAPNWSSPYFPHGASEELKNTLMADQRAVTPGFFNAFGVLLIEGRLFTELDRNRSNPVVIVDELLARRHWPEESAVGKRLNVGLYDDGSFPSGWAEIIGVVAHVRHHSLTEEVREQVYLPHAIASRPELVYVLRTSSEPNAIIAPIRHALSQMDRSLAISKVRTMSSYVNEAMATTRFTTILAGLFAGVAVLLASIGIYGIIAYSVQCRTSEIGLRLSLGAGRLSILKLVLNQGIPLIVTGVVLGMVASFGFAHSVSSLLFGVTPIDPVTYLATSSGIVVVAMLALIIPARRAMKVDPMTALRCE